MIREENAIGAGAGYGLRAGLSYPLKKSWLVVGLMTAAAVTRFGTSP